MWSFECFLPKQRYSLHFILRYDFWRRALVLRCAFALLILPNHLLFPCSANQTVRYNVRNGTKREMYAPTEICLPGVQTFRYASFSSYFRQGVRTLPLSVLPDINTEGSATHTGMHTTGCYSLSLILQLHGYSV